MPEEQLGWRGVRWHETVKSDGGGPTVGPVPPDVSLIVVSLVLARFASQRVKVRLIGECPIPRAGKAIAV